MNRSLLEELKNQAKTIVRGLPKPALYANHPEDTAFAWEVFFNHPLLVRLQGEALQYLYDDYMFGIEHAKRMAQDTGLLILLETSNLPQEESRPVSIQGQAAGMLSGLERGDEAPGHLAETASMVLTSAELRPGERERILWAIEHFRDDPVEPPDEEAGVLAAALYDAAKFRYGTDILPTALWMHCDYSTASAREVRECLQGHVPGPPEDGGFRTRTGQRYGAEIMEQGRLVIQEMVRFLEEL